MCRETDRFPREKQTDKQKDADTSVGPIIRILYIYLSDRNFNVTTSRAKVDTKVIHDQFTIRQSQPMSHI